MDSLFSSTTDRKSSSIISLTHRQNVPVTSVHYTLLHFRLVKRDGTFYKSMCRNSYEFFLLHSITDTTYTRIFQCAIRKHRKATLLLVFSSFTFVYCLEFPLRDRIFLWSREKKQADKWVRFKSWTIGQCVIRNIKSPGVCCCDNLARTLAIIVDADSVVVFTDSLKKKIFLEN